MKQNTKHALIYDDNCPMCAAYTMAFVKAGLLSGENRISFSALETNRFKMDMNRARHEIPLVDLATGEVKYGIDALAEILNQRLPFVKSIIYIKPVEWFFRKLYRFISYNRTIIVAGPARPQSCFDCSPDFDLRLRTFLGILVSIAAGVIMQKVMVVFNNPTCASLVLLWPAVTLITMVGKTKQQAADILVHSAITMLLSACVLLFSLNIFSWLFTSLQVVTALSAVAAVFVLTIQLKRRIQHYSHEYNR